MSKNKKKIQLCLADDHKFFLDIMKFMLTAYDHKKYQFVVKQTCQNKEELFSTIKDKSIDVFLLDLDFDQSIGVGSIIKECMKRNNQISVIVCSMCSGYSTIDQCYQHGVKGYVEKKENESQHIINAIETVLDGNIYFAPGMSEKLAIYRYNNPLKQLTKDQQNYVLLTAEGYTKADIASYMGVSVKTLDGWASSAIKTAIGVTPSHYKEYAQKHQLLN